MSLRKILFSILVLLVDLLGCGLMGYGLYQIWAPLMWIGLGAGCFWLAHCLAAVLE